MHRDPNSRPLAPLDFFPWHNRPEEVSPEEVARRVRDELCGGGN